MPLTGGQLLEVTMYMFTTCKTCDKWRPRDFIRVIRVIRGDLVILYV